MAAMGTKQREGKGAQGFGSITVKPLSQLQGKEQAPPRDGGKEGVLSSDGAVGALGAVL